MLVTNSKSKRHASYYQDALCQDYSRYYSLTSDCICQSMTFDDRNFKSDYIGALSRSTIYNLRSGEPYLQSPRDKRIFFDLQSSIWGALSSIFNLQETREYSTIFDLQPSIWGALSSISKRMKIQFACSYERRERCPSIQVKLFSISFRVRSILWSANTNSSAQDWTIEWNSFVSRVRLEWSSRRSSSFGLTRLASAQGFARCDGHAALTQSMLRLWLNWLWLGAKSGSNGCLETLVGSFWPPRFNCNWHPSSSSTMTTIHMQVFRTASGFDLKSSTLQ